MYDTRTPQVPPTVANAIPDQVALPGVRFEYQFPENTFADANRTDRLTYGAELENGDALPSWLAFDAGTRTFAGTPGAGDGGVVMVKVTADDGRGGTVSDTFRLKVNRPPTASASTVTATESTDHPFAVADFGFSDTDAGDVLAGVKVTSLPATGFGSLELDGNVLTAADLPQAVTEAQLGAGELVFRPVAGQFRDGYATFGFRVNDGTEDSADAAVMTVDVDPASGHVALVGNLGETVANATFEVGNASGAQTTQGFHTGNHRGKYNLHSVGIALDHNGFSASETLTLSIWSSHRDGTANAEVHALTTPWPSGPDIPADGIVYFTAADGAVLDAATDYHLVVHGSGNSAGDARIELTAADGQAGEANWTIEDSSRASGTLHPGGSIRMVVRGSEASVANTAPTAAAGTVTATESTDHAFRATDFGFMDMDSLDSLASVKIVSLPATGFGTLVLDGNAITTASEGAPQTVTRAELDDGKLVFRPVSGQFGDGYATFMFKVNDGAEDSAEAYAMTVDVDPDPGHVLLVGNMSLASTDIFTVGSATGKRATQGFTAGGHPGGYRLHSVGIELAHNDFAGAQTLTLSIYSSNEDGTANALVHALTTPWTSGAEIPTDGIVYFTAAAGANLVAGTRYHVVIHGTGATGDARVETSGGNGETGETGWTIEDAFRHNGALWSTGESFRIAVRGSERTNAAPTVANRLPDQAAIVGSDFSYQFAADSFADGDGDELEYTAVESGETGLPSWLTFTPATRTFSGRPTAAGTVTVEVTADDGRGGSVSDTFEIVVLAPALVSNTGQTAASAGELVIETGSVAQQFTTGATASGYALTQVQAYLDSFVGAGVPRVRIFTTGGDGNPGESLYELTNPSSIVNGALNAFTAPAGAVLLKETRYFAVFEQASGAASYRVGATASNAEDAGKATGWSIADESRFRSSNTWRANTAVQLRIAVRGADAPASAAPTVANALLDQTAIVGSDFTYRFAADSFADQDAHDRLAYTAAGLPGWLSFDASTRTFSGRPGAGDTGSATVTVTADDRRGGTVSDAFDIVVLDPVLVGNEGSTADNLPTASRSAQAFTTGSHAGGYALTGIRLLGAFTGAGGTVTLHEGTREGTKVADFTAVNTSPGVLDDHLVLTPAAATALDADTTYVVVTANDFGAVDLWTTTASDSEDADPAAGWTIADGGEAYQSGSWGTTASAFRLTVHGTRSGAANAAPTAADSEVTATESTDHAFTADHFGYMDGDNDTLASVKVTSLPGAGLGQLVLDGTHGHLGQRLLPAGGHEGAAGRRAGSCTARWPGSSGTTWRPSRSG